MSRLAEVALPLGVDHTFTYLVPPALDDAAAVGCRAIVPFGTRTLTGVIIDRPPESPLGSLKPLRDVVDADPVIPPELLALCRWVAEYYLAPLGEVLKAALPHGFGGTGRRTVTPADTAALPVDAGAAKTARGKILALLLRHGELTTTDLRKRTGVRSINAVLNAMERDGLIVITDQLPAPQPRPRVRKFVDADAVDDDALTRSIAALPPRRAKARRMLEYISDRRRAGAVELAVSDLLRATGTGLATLRPFVRSGLLPVSERIVTRQQEYGTDEQVRSIVLNEVQRRIVERIAGAVDAGAGRTFLLHGVTGSGKTQVYIEAIRRCFAAGKTALVLVPEIGLTPQMVRRFRTHFGDAVAVVHSRMAPAERHEVWRRALEGSCRVVIGPRSAVFAPLSDLGLLIVDEEHEASYKQYDATPRYHARDTAVVRGSLCRAVVVLGSATPSAESTRNAAQGKYELLTMPERVERVRMPDILLVDMREERRREYAALRESLPPEEREKLRGFRQSSLSALLSEKIADRLGRGEGIIVLQNRRGFAPFMECCECGHIEACTRCNVTLTYHLARRHLRCHYCGAVRAAPELCPHCRGPHLELRGAGTQRVEQDLAAKFPAARILRMDLDTTTRRGSHERILGQFGRGEADILLGTQMVAKGLDFARVTLVGVISADTQLLLPDFRASERTFQLLTQVAGRAGRSSLQGEVVIQTHQPEHFALRAVAGHDLPGFFEAEMASRRELGYPPFSRLVLVEFSGRNEEAVQKGAERFRTLLGSTDDVVLGPAPAVITRIRNRYRWHILLKNNRAADPSGARLRSLLRRTLASSSAGAGRSVRVIIDVDPAGTM